MSDIFIKITSLHNLLSAWQEFRRGKRKKKDVQIFERHLEDNIWKLHIDLRTGKYKHGSYYKFHIFDPKHRVIHKAKVRDRILHHATHRIIYPIFDESFIFDSYSCRNSKGTHAAVKRIQYFARKISKNYTSPCWALKLDIKKFFNSIDHDILLKVLEKKILCDKTKELLEEILKSYEIEPGKGLPLGNLTSQLFANTYLNAFDHFMKEELQIKYYLRYTDDIIILHNNRDELIRLIPHISSYLNKQRLLELHPRKITIRKLKQGIDFLGYVILPHSCVLRTKTKRCMFKRVNNQNISSYLGLLKHCNSYILRLNLVKSMKFKDLNYS